MAKSHLKLVTSNAVKRTVTPKRRRNGALRTRQYLTEAEVERLMKVATRNRHGHRDATMILVANWWTCDGIRSTSGRPRCTSAGLSRARPARTRSSVTNCEPCG